MVMELTLISGTANPPLAEGIAAQLGLPLGRRVLQRFPDGELHVEIAESVRGHDVYLLQPTSPPTDAHLFELAYREQADLVVVGTHRRQGLERLRFGSVSRSVLHRATVTVAVVPLDCEPATQQDVPATTHSTNGERGRKKNHENQ